MTRIRYGLISDLRLWRKHSGFVSKANKNSYFGGCVMMRVSLKGSSVSNRPTFCTIFLIIACIGLAVFLLSGCKKEKKTEVVPTVEVAEVVQKDVPIFAEWVGTLDGMVNATIRAQVQGYLIKQNYKEGDLVKKGQVLFEIDPRTYRAALEEAKGQLAQAEARWQTAKANLARIRPLAEQNAVSKKDLDDAIGAQESTKASVVSANAALKKAQLNLDWTRVTSLIDGIAGIAKAQIGNLVGPGQIEELTTVSTVNPIKAYVSLSEQEYMTAQESKKTQVGRIPLELILGDGTVFPQKGEVAFADRQVDARTGTIMVATVFPNPNNLLRPGQFARIRAQMGLKKNALLIPQRAVTEVQGRYLVAMVSTDNKVAIKQVKAAERYGQLWVIDEGLQAGDKVVAEGVQKVKDGMVVNPKPFEPQPPSKPEEGQKGETKTEPVQKAGPKPTVQPKPEKR
ncbi:MAG: Multidrug resistance protein MdtE precursor [Syntrophorhabdus sp. PtaU1.Bin002]|nr:MAG: Multidrug resistance protein MdtE precursor [Syntrophorhabdus sp. PtaB.Bin006]OPY69315.1 MAG: Multidrug resistance protein MdtE precursor [Syntrophorhabdus sp. PtaU1.Bin002]